MRAPIFAGPLRGRWWLLESRGKLARILLGSYEPEQTRLFREHVRPGDTVLDVGANVGYYTLLSALLAGPSGAVWEFAPAAIVDCGAHIGTFTLLAKRRFPRAAITAFEPNPRNAGFLRRHAKINGLRQVRVEQAAVSDAEGTARFDFGTGSGTGHLSSHGAIEVRTLRLDDFCAANGIVPRAVKIDVEGAEAAVLEGFAATVDAARPVIFLSTHGPEAHAACVAWLRARGYALSPIVGGSVDTATELLCTPAGA